jgi:hypothetical protein
VPIIVNCYPLPPLYFHVCIANTGLSWGYPTYVLQIKDLGEKSPVVVRERHVRENGSSKSAAQGSAGGGS